MQAQYDADRKAFAKDLANYELMLSQCNEDKRKWGSCAIWPSWR